MRCLTLSLLVFSACHPIPKSAPPSSQVGVDETAIDRSVAPCEDFYRYACGGWLGRTQVPKDAQTWMRSFSEICVRNQDLVRKILEDAASGDRSNAASPTTKLGDYYAACMAEPEVEAKSPAVLSAAFKRIDEATSPAALVKALAQLQRSFGGPLFVVTVRSDGPKGIAVLAESGLGLPDAEIYRRNDAQAAEILKLYEAHIRKML